MRYTPLVLATALSTSCRSDNSATVPGSLASAEAFAFGTGQKRDFERAAAVYERLCADGTGDTEACRRLLRAMATAQGVKADGARIIELARTLCHTREDAIGCSLLVRTGRIASDPKAEAVLDERLSCTAARPDICQLGPNPFGLGGDEEFTEWHDIACGFDALDSCVALIDILTMCASEDGALECARRIEASWREDGDTVRIRALEKLRARCDLGDPIACDALPGREISYSELCAAHDYGACAALGCLGDTGAGQIGESHGGRANCYFVKNRQRAKDADADAGVH